MRGDCGDVSQITISQSVHVSRNIPANTEDRNVNHAQPHPRSIEGFARRHGISRATVYNLHHRGMLNFTKIGRRTIITEAQEAAWLTKSERGYA